jgi:glutathione S-transferase
VLTLYEFAPSGNCHKVRLMLSLLGLAWRGVAVNGREREQKTAAFLIADVAVYPYVALVPEGQVDLAPWPALVRWLGRVQALPGYVGMPGMAAGN